MHRIGRLVLSLPLMASCAVAVPPQHETIIFLRHGEKPPAGLGQIDCQGLNRALALPKILATRFGTPAAIFAPDPAQTIQDRGVNYNYIRPLATIEPTAVSFNLPINSAYGVRDIPALEAALTAPHYQNGLIFVAWEHRIAATVARDLLRQNGGNPTTVPDWPGPDFDSLYIVTITRNAGKTTAAFTHDAEHLDNQPLTCP